MTRQKWTDIKARVKPETRARIEADARRLSEELHNLLHVLDCDVDLIVRAKRA